MYKITVFINTGDKKKIPLYLFPRIKILFLILYIYIGHLRVLQFIYRTTEKFKLK